MATPATAVYADLADLRNRIEKRSDADDATLDALLTAASRAIDGFCNRPDGFVAPSTTSLRYYRGSGTVIQPVDECVAITAVAVKDSPSDTTYTAWTAPSTNWAGDGDWYPAAGDPDAPWFNVLPFTMIIVDPNGDNDLFTGGQSSERWWPSSRRRRLANRGRFSAVLRVPTVQVTARWGYDTSTPEQIREACAMQTARWFKRYQGSMADSLATTDLGELRFTRVLDPDIENLLVGGRFLRPAVGRRP